MDKGELLPEAITVKGQPSDAVKIAKIITLGVFFTSVVTICVFFAARYGSIASAERQPCSFQPADNRKLSDKDLRRERDLKTKDGLILHERFTYDHKSNTVMVQTPGNISGDFPATLVIDHDRALVFSYVKDQGVCLVYPLLDDFWKLVSEELSATDRNVVDVAHATLINERYVVAGEIPEGFVESSGGQTVHGLCAGRPTYWLDRADEDGSNNKRTKIGPVTKGGDQMIEATIDQFRYCHVFRKFWKEQSIYSSMKISRNINQASTRSNQPQHV